MERLGDGRAARRPWRPTRSTRRRRRGCVGDGDPGLGARHLAGVGDGVVPGVAPLVGVGEEGGADQHVAGGEAGPVGGGRELTVVDPRSCSALRAPEMSRLDKVVVSASTAAQPWFHTSLPTACSAALQARSARVLGSTEAWWRNSGSADAGGDERVGGVDHHGGDVVGGGTAGGAPPDGAPHLLPRTRRGALQVGRGAFAEATVEARHRQVDGEGPALVAEEGGAAEEGDGLEQLRLVVEGAELVEEVGHVGEPGQPQPRRCLVVGEPLGDGPAPLGLEAAVARAAHERRRRAG